MGFSLGGVVNPVLLGTENARRNAVAGRMCLSLHQCLEIILNLVAPGEIFLGLLVINGSQVFSAERRGQFMFEIILA